VKGQEALWGRVLHEGDVLMNSRVVDDHPIGLKLHRGPRRFPFGLHGPPASSNDTRKQGNLVSLWLCRSAQAMFIARLVLVQDGRQWLADRAGRRFDRKVQSENPRGSRPRADAAVGRHKSAYTGTPWRICVGRDCAAQVTPRVISATTLTMEPHETWRRGAVLLPS